jgi:hypothetical protein
VAGRTDLLSTNAASEAEKAAEYGRDPLVVAREARRLADQTAVATLDTESMVRPTQDAVPAGVLQTDKFGEEVRCGVGRAAGVNGQAAQIIAGVAAPRALRVGQRGDEQPGGRRPGGPSRPAGRAWAPRWPARAGRTSSNPVLKKRPHNRPLGRR